MGREVTGLMANDASWGEEVKIAARLAGERVWKLPLVQEYEEWLRSSVADLKNHGGISEAGAIQGALFLKQFVGETPWVHLDIAGTIHSRKTRGIHRRRGHGRWRPHADPVGHPLRRPLRSSRSGDTVSGLSRDSAVRPCKSSGKGDER